MKTSEAFPSKYLKAADLGDRNWELTIDDYKIEELQSPDGKKQTKPVLYFRRTQKGLVLNIVNTRAIETMYGDEMDDWIGKSITLWVREVEARGEMVNAIRVRIAKPGQSTAPSHHQPRPAPTQPAARKPAAEHAGQTPVYTEANPPPNTGEGYRADVDDEIPFEMPWK